MSEPKFKRGQTVTILSRKENGENADIDEYIWENSHLGENAIIEKFYISHGGNNAPTGSIIYSLFLLYDNGPGGSCAWFEERFLKLYCSNEE